MTQEVKISALPAGTANANAVVPATNAAGTATEKITLGAIAALGGGPPATHASTHATGQGDALAPADIGAAYAPIHSITAIDQTVTGTSLLDADDMSFTAAANTTYLIDMLLIADDVGGGEFDAQVFAPGGADVFGKWPNWSSYVPAPGTFDVTTRTTILYDTMYAAVAVPVQFIVRTAGTSGVVKLQFCQVNAYGAGAVLRAGSYIVARRIS